jgi:hypothetical protein
MSTRRWAIGLWMFVCLGACDDRPRGSGAHDGGIDLALAADGFSSSLDATASACFEPQETASVSTAGSLVQACAIWNSLSSLTGQVTIARTGASLVLAFASGVTFNGTVTGNDVSLTHAQTHPFTDGCLWLATETLVGTLDPTTCAMSLAYTYVETVSMSNGACATPCAASSTVTFSFQPIL